MTKLFSLGLISLLALTACAPFRPDNTHAGLCNELNSQLIFNGNTSDVRKSEIESSEEPLVQRSFDKNDCG